MPASWRERTGRHRRRAQIPGQAEVDARSRPASPATTILPSGWIATSRVWNSPDRSGLDEAARCRTCRRGSRRCRSGPRRSSVPESVTPRHDDLAVGLQRPRRRAEWSHEVGMASEGLTKVVPRMPKVGSRLPAVSNRATSQPSRCRCRTSSRPRRSCRPAGSRNPVGLVGDGGDVPLGSDPTPG